MCRDPSEFARLGCEVAIVDVDQDIEQAVHVIEGICTRSASTTVMACSAKKELALVRRAMQAGARDFLPEPVLLETMKDALARISFRRIFQEQTPGKVLVFTSSKAGVGVTSLAANFAIALTRESASRVVVVDLDLHGGDIALGLGLTASCSVADAHSNPTRLAHEAHFRSADACLPR
jgi:pilus assembly protein CpaE